MPDSQESVELLSEPEEQLDRDPLGEDLDEETRAAPTTSDGGQNSLGGGGGVLKSMLHSCACTCVLRPPVDIKSAALYGLNKQIIINIISVAIPDHEHISP